MVKKCVTACDTHNSVLCDTNDVCEIFYLTGAKLFLTLSHIVEKVLSQVRKPWR